MRNVIAQFGLVVLSSMALSCGAENADPDVLDGTGGDSGNSPSSGGASVVGSGGGGANPVDSAGGTSGSGGADETGSGGTNPEGTGGDGAGGGNPDGSGGTEEPGDPDDIWGGLKNPPRKSSGCDKPKTMTSGAKTIMSGGRSREYIIDIPANYDPATPYRLFHVGHGIPGKGADVPPGWWNIRGEANAAKVDAIWIAPSAVTGGSGAWSNADDRDHVLFDDIIAAVEADLCVDTTRIFVAGMSGGGMLSNALATDRQKVIRAGAGMAPTNFNIWLPNPKPTDPVAWMQTTGMGDPICSWITNEGQKRGAKFIALEKAANNGCTIPAEIPIWESGNHVCYEFEGCKLGYPVKVCTFNGGHVHFNSDPGSSENWIAKDIWDFFMQF